MLYRRKSYGKGDDGISFRGFSHFHNDRPSDEVEKSIVRIKMVVGGIQSVHMGRTLLVGWLLIVG